MLNLHGRPLPQDDIPNVFVNGGPEDTWGDYHVFRDVSGKLVRVVLREYYGFHQMDVLLYAAPYFAVHRKGDPVPYDTVLATTVQMGVTHIFGRDTQNDNGYMHICLSGEYDLISRLIKEPETEFYDDPNVTEQDRRDAARDITGTTPEAHTTE